MNSPIQTTSPSFYVSGSMIMMVFLLFCNSRMLPKFDLENISNSSSYVLDEQAQRNMMTSILAGSVGGLCLLILRNQFYTSDNG